METRAPWLSLVAGLLIAGSLSAHEMRPAYLEIRETETDTYDVLWKVPARGESERLSLHLRLADDVSTLTEPVSGFLANAHIQRLRVQRHGGLTGTSIAIEGLTGTFTDVLVRLEHLDGTEVTHRLTPDQPSFVVPQGPNLRQVAWTYFVIGVEHILFGIDHLLFVFALLLIVGDWKKLIGTITAFTVAHSVTLGLATLGLVDVPGPPVEAVIALSIVFVAAELIRGNRGRPGLTARAPWVVSFSFGLLHGFGFAGALNDVGLPQKSIPLALLTFNVGVEAGQLLFVASVLCLHRITKRLHQQLPAWMMDAPAYVIGSMAVFWVLERTTGFWTP